MKLASSANLSTVAIHLAVHGPYVWTCSLHLKQQVFHKLHLNTNWKLFPQFYFDSRGNKPATVIANISTIISFYSNTNDINAAIRHLKPLSLRTKFFFSFSSILLTFRLLHFVIFLFIARQWKKKKEEEKKALLSVNPEMFFVACWLSEPIMDMKTSNLFSGADCITMLYLPNIMKPSACSRGSAVPLEHLVHMRWLQIPWAGFLGHGDVFYFNGIRPSTAPARFKSFLWRSPADSSFNETLIPSAPGRPFRN